MIRVPAVNYYNWDVLQDDPRDLRSVRAIPTGSPKLSVSQQTRRNQGTEYELICDEGGEWTWAWKTSDADGNRVLVNKWGIVGDLGRSGGPETEVPDPPLC